MLVGWSAQVDPGFGVDQTQSVKYKIVNLISAVRTLMRSKARSTEAAKSYILN